MKIHVPKRRAVRLKPEERLLQPHLIGHLCPLVGSDDADSKAAVIAYIEAMAPTDAIEELLVAQMLATFQAGMGCIRRAATEADKLGLRDIELRHGEKLLNLFSRLFEAFEKRRNRLEIERVVPGLAGLTQFPTR